jgi:hypothetical protein
VSRLADSRELTNFSMQIAARLSNWSAMHSRVFFAQAMHCESDIKPRLEHNAKRSSLHFSVVKLLELCLASC